MWNQKVKILYGEEAMRDFYESIITAKPKEYLIFGSAGRAADVVAEKYWLDFEKKRIALGIKTRRIYNDTADARESESKYGDRTLREIRFNPTIGRSPIITVTYQDKVIFSSWSIKNPFFITIENDELAEGFRKEFEALWNQREHTYHGIEGVQRVLENVFLEEPKEILLYGSSGASIRSMPDFIAKWHKERARKQIMFKAMYTDTPESRHRVSFLDRNYLEVRYLPSSYQSSIGTMVYCNKVILFSLMERNYFAVVIENKEFAHFHGRQFGLLWEISKKR
jgi:hypothetical protein